MRRPRASHDDDLTDDAGQLGAEAIDHQPQHDAQEGAGQDGGRDHQALFGRTYLKRLRDLNAKRPEQHPDHEADVEIKECGEQSGWMTRFPKTRLHGTPFTEVSRSPYTPLVNIVKFITFIDRSVSGTWPATWQ